MSTPDLPEGFRSRPLQLEDSRAVFDLMAAQDLADLGTVEIEEADLLGDWQRPSFDLAACTVGVLDPTTHQLVGYAEVSGPERGDAAVHPDYRGRGVGTWLAHWTQRTALGRGAERFGMPVPEGSSGDVLLTALGYDVRWTSWILRLGPDERIVDRALPPGYRLAAAEVEHRPAIWRVVEDAFLESSDRERDTFEDFGATTWERPGFEPWNLRVVTDPEGEVVGVAQCWVMDSAETYVARLAVRADQRGRGLAQALLVDAFAQGRLRGATTSCLGADSRTGALSLYESVGMHITSTWLHRSVWLTGRDAESSAD